MTTDITIYQPAIRMTLDQTIRAWLDEKALIVFALPTPMKRL